ncbi:hypothetical protein VTO42DRAFT_7259 [Malbranchea cinnamomea]
MAAVRLSPTANLLRKSRLFALPPTLSPPVEPATSSTVAESDTATLPYPIRAAIETPSSSLARGDWGLKRPLPSKSTTDKSLYPVVRINQLDTFEHVTDFESANDHVMTLKKFQELSLPISMTTNTGIVLGIGGGRHESVFESSLDNMSPNKSPGSKRYRFRGPWLAGQTEAEFEKFMKFVRRQKPAFLAMVRKHLESKRQADEERKSRDEGEERPVSKPAPLSDEEFKEALKQLRADPRALGPLINQFFDLATPPKTPNSRLYRSNWEAGPSDLSSLEYAGQGPPKTHPSAGLSYIRTLSHLDNHPIAGPQEHSRPVQARLLQSKVRVRSTTIKAIVGIGGIVTEDSHTFSFRDYSEQTAGTHISPDVPGGAKFWGRPERASVTSEGTINLRVARAVEASKSLYGVGQAPKPLPDRVKGVDRDAPKLA